MRPDLPWLTSISRARSRARGEGRARARCSRRSRRGCPTTPAVLAQLGKLLHRQGERDEALAAARRARAAAAGSGAAPLHRARRGARAEDADAPREDLARRYAADGAAMVAGKPLPRRARPARRRAGARRPAVVLLDRRVVRVHRNGLAETFAQRVVEVATDHGAEDNKEFYVRYTPGIEEVEIRQARIFRRGADGRVQVLEAAERDDEDLSEPWYGLYYDNRAEVVRFEGLRAGDVLEVQYLVDDVSRREPAGRLLRRFAVRRRGRSPSAAGSTRCIGPAEPRLLHQHAALPRLAQQATEEGDEQASTAFAARDVATIDSEPAHARATAEVAPYLHVSTYASWGDVGAWYWRLVEEQLVPDDALAPGGARGAGAGDDRRAKRCARSTTWSYRHALRRARVRHPRLQAVQGHAGAGAPLRRLQGQGVADGGDAARGGRRRRAGAAAHAARRPHRAGAGVAGRLRSRDRVRAQARLYLDGTAEFSGVAELPNQDQGVMVLRVGPRGSTLTETPVLPSSREPRRAPLGRRGAQADGDARVDEQLTITGRPRPNGASTTRRRASGPIATARSGTGAIPGARLGRSTCRRIEDRNQPVTVDAVASVPRLGQAVAPPPTASSESSAC